MGMRIGQTGANSAASSTAATGSASAWQQRQQGIKDLFKAIDTGNLDAAKDALATLTGPNGLPKGNSALAQINQAVSSGDLAGAQQAAQAWQTSRAGGHHHHDGPASAAPAASSTPAMPLAASGPGSTLNVVA
ncbi:MAG: hypothetical protein AB9M60_16960 [Leptothrix sp. (in: b-proteobacteria)]